MLWRKALDDEGAWVKRFTKLAIGVDYLATVRYAEAPDHRFEHSFELTRTQQLPKAERLLFAPKEKVYRFDEPLDTFSIPTQWTLQCVSYLLLKMKCCHQQLSL